MNRLRLIGALMFCAPLFPVSTMGQTGPCSAFAGHWKGYTNTYDPFEIDISADGAKITYGGYTIPCVVKDGKLDYHYPAFDFVLGQDGKGIARYGTQSKTIALKRLQ